MSRLRDLALRLESPTPGGVALVVVAVANVLPSALAPPVGQPTEWYAGEICGAEAGGWPSQPWLRLGLPLPMTVSLVAGFRELGVPSSRLRSEQFAAR